MANLKFKFDGALDQRNANCDDPIEHLVDTLQAHVYDDKGCEVESAVYHFVESLVKDIGCTKPWLKASEIVKHGSFYDHTKLCEPNEFDYAVILEHYDLDKTKVRALPAEGGTFSLLKHSKGNGTSDACWMSISPKAVRKTYYEELSKVLLKQPARFVETNCSWKEKEVMTADQTKSEEQFQSNPTSTLRVLDVEERNPNTLIKLEFGNFKLTLDISVMIRYRDVHHLIEGTGVEQSPLGGLALASGNGMLMAFNDGFRVTFPDMERDFVANNLSCRHRKLIVYLKYIKERLHMGCGKIVDGERHFVRMTPYLIKTLVLYHDAKCSNSKGPLDICVRDIIAMIQSSLMGHKINHKSIPNIFIDSLLISSEKTSPELAWIDHLNVGFLPNLFDSESNMYLSMLRRKQFVPVDLRSLYLYVLKCIHITLCKDAASEYLVERLDRCITCNTINMGKIYAYFFS